MNGCRFSPGKARPAAFCLGALFLLSGRPASSHPLSELVKELDDSTDSAVVDLEASYLPVIRSQSGATLPRKATLKALRVKNSDTLLGAFVAAFPPGSKRCSDKAAETPKVFWLSVPQGSRATAVFRLSEVKTRAFDSLKPTVGIPSAYPKVPFFTVEYSPDCENLPSGGGSLYSGETTVEVWSIVPRGARELKSFKSYAYTPAGTSSEVTVNLAWIEGQRSHYLAAMEFSKSRTPLTSAPSGSGNDPTGVHFSCQRTTTVFALTSAGGWSVVPRSRLAVLKAQVPAFRSLKQDGSAQGNSEEASLPACDALEK
jgi:hypothetical protein